MNEGSSARDKKTPDSNRNSNAAVEAGPADAIGGGDCRFLESPEFEGTDDWWAELLSDPSTLESMQLLGSVGCFGEALTGDLSFPGAYLEGLGNGTSSALPESNPDESHVRGVLSALTTGPSGEASSDGIAGTWSPDNIMISNTYRPSPGADKHLEAGQAAISLSCNSTKDPAWGTPSLLIGLSSTQPMMMHLLLAASLRSSAIDRNDDLRTGTDSSPEHHFSVGSHLLVDILDNRQDLEPSVNILAAFWLVYMYWANISNPSCSDVGRQQRLGQAAADYMKLHELLDSCTGNLEPGKGNSDGAYLSWATRSLVARLIVWLFYADAWAHFRNHGGQLASYLCENESSARQVYLTSRNVLLANWGSRYPVDLVVDDLETSPALDLLFEVYLCLERVNSYSSERDSRIEDDFQNLEERFSGLFLLTTLERSGQAKPRLLEIANYVVANFYAVQIYCSWYTEPRSFKPLIGAGGADRPLSRLLAILYKNFSHGSPKHRRFQWPFLIAGAETSDPIQRDWILQRMSPDLFKLTL